MKKKEVFLTSRVDQLRLSLVQLEPQEMPVRGIVQLVHGMCENKERYLPFMEYLTSQGYASVIHDHRGHGGSVKSIEDLGYMYGAGAEGLLDDILLVNSYVRESWPDVPVILFGHSMGSLAVRAFAAEHDDLIDALLISGSPSENPARALGELLARGEAALRGEMHRSHLLTGMSLGSYARRFKEESPLAWLSRDPMVQQAYAESPYCGFLFSDDAYLTLFQLMKRAYDVKGFQCTKPDLPVLFLSGREDPCMVSMRKFALAVQSMRRAGYRDVRGKVYEGMRHEILNEPDHEKVYRDIRNYLKHKGL